MKFKILIFTCFLLSLVLSNNPRIFGGDDHDKVANQITTLISNLHKKSLSDLRDYALSLESYRANGEMVYGGLHDYITQYNEQSLIKYIVSVCIEKRELLDSQKFNAVIAQFSANSNSIKKAEETEKTSLNANNKKSTEKIEKTEKSNASTEQSFEDFLNVQSRNTLIKWALTCEYFENLKKQAPLVGGLHDYIETLSDREIADYIMGLVDVYPELGNKKNLDQFALEYEIQYESKDESDNADEKKDDIEKTKKTEKGLKFLAADPEPEPEGEGGLVDFIFRLSREKVSQYAFAAEKYEHEATGMQIKGGILDYIDELTNQQIAWFVLDIARKFPELNSKEFLDSLVCRYGFDKIIS